MRQLAKRGDITAFSQVETMALPTLEAPFFRDWKKFFIII
jgi:hypothetical protein